MAEIDPLVLRLMVDDRDYKAKLRASTALATDSLKRQENSAKRLEAQMRKSSGAISGSLKGIATGLAGAFGAREIVGLIDNFTRLQNSLRVSGLEGENLAAVQSELLGLSSKYGVSINDLADLYGKSSQAAGDLGASTAQLLQITEASAQALKITGTSAVQAQGALLGLTQALSSGRVKAEEFNQINEGGLRPLLQAAANTEKYGGSVAKLRAAVVDGKLSSQEFYQAILNGSAELEGKASKATLTLAGAFAALGSNLTVYVGEASKANGVTVALSSAIGALANNLDVLIPALAIIAVGLGVGVATNAIAARVATDALGKSLLSAFGGPVGIAITAIAIAMGFVVKEAASLSAAIANADAKLADAKSRFDSYSDAARDAGISVDASGQAAIVAGNKFDVLGGIIGRSISLYKDLAANARFAAIAVAQSNIATAQSDANKSKIKLALGQINPLQRAVPGFGQDENALNVQKQNALIAQERANIALLSRLPDGAIKAPKGAAPSSVSSGSDKKKKDKSAKGASGPSENEILLRFNNELIALTQQTLSAQKSLAVNAEDRAELELRSVELAQRSAIAGINSDKNYTATQKKRLIQQVDVLAFEEREGIERQRTAQLAQEAADLAEVENRTRVAALVDQYDLATSNKERLRLALSIVDTETKAAVAAVDEQIIQAKINGAKTEKLEALRREILAQGDRDKNNALLGNKGAAETELDRLNKLNFGDESEKFGVDALKDLNRGLADAIVNGGNLGDVLEDTGKRFIAQLIQMAFQLLVIKPLLESLGGSFGGGSGSGGITGITSLLSGLFGGGRASGGPVQGGRVYRVNESQKEFFRPNVGGDIIPLSRMNVAASGGAQQPIVLKVYADEGSTFVPRVEAISGQVSVQVVRASAPTIIDAGANEALRRSGRPRL